jgi:hypothetical protein
MEFATAIYISGFKADLTQIGAGSQAVTVYRFSEAGDLVSILRSSSEQVLEFPQ